MSETTPTPEAPVARRSDGRGNVDICKALYATGDSQDLLAYMENWSKESYAAGWLSGLADVMAASDEATFRPMVEAAGGWYISNTGEREFVEGTWDQLVTSWSGES
jgi:hypothetical protein